MTLFVRYKHKNTAGRVLPTRMFNSLAVLVVLMFVPAAAQTPGVVGELFASEPTAQGPALLAGTGMSVGGGSQLSAGTSTATLRLARGGEVKICPRSGLAVNTLPDNAGLMLSMGASAVELNYPVNDVADTLITPDFKLLLAGPGLFHVAVGVTSRGDTCVKTLRGNSSSIIVSEMLGSGMYQIKPNESVVFLEGKVNKRGTLTTNCGCPSPAPVMRAENRNVAPGNPLPEPAARAGLPAETPGEVHVQVDAPLVFHGDQPVQQAYTVARVNFSSLPNVFFMQEEVQPGVLKEEKPEVSQKKDKPVKVKEKKGFFGRLKGFFGSLFH